MVTNEQLYLSVGVPLLFNAALIGLLMAWANAKFDRIEAKFEGKFQALESELAVRFSAIDRRFDDMRDLWRAELHRVEEILDARLKHLEDRR